MAGTAAPGPGTKLISAWPGRSRARFAAEGCDHTGTRRSMAATKAKRLIVADLIVAQRTVPGAYRSVRTESRVAQPMRARSASILARSSAPWKRLRWSNSSAQEAPRSRALEKPL